MDYSKFSDAALGELSSGKAPDWSKFNDAELQELSKGPAPSAATHPEADSVVEEMHPDVAYSDRALVKNFSNSPQNSLNYLKKQYPNLQMKLGGDDGDRVLIKRPEEKDWKTLDPDAGILKTLRTNPSEILKDLGDVGYDAAAGLASGAATAAGGVIGNLPGAALGGGTSSAALEAARQKIGESAGVNPDGIHGGDVAVTGALGAVAPLIFGSGASAKAIGNAAIEKAGQDATAEQLFQTSKGMAEGQRGALGRLRDYFLPKVGAATSGVPADVIKTMAERMPELKNLESSGVTDYAAAKADQMRQTFQSTKSEIGQTIGNLLEQTGKKIDLTEARAPLEDLLAKLEKQQGEAATPALQEKIDTVKKSLKDFFTRELPEQPAQAPSMILGPNGMPAVAGTAAVPAQRQSIAEVSPRTAMNLKQDLADLAGFVGMKNPEGISTRHAGNATAFEKQLADAAAKATDALSGKLEDASADLGPNVAEYKRLTRLQKDLSPYFTDPERTYATLRNLGGKAKRVLFEKLTEFDKEFGTDMTPSAKMVQAFSHFSHGANDAISGGGTTSTSRTLLGGGLGYAAGQAAGETLAPDNHTAGHIGGAIGAVLGTRAGGPAAIRKLVEAYQSKAGQAVRAPLSGGYAPMSTWNFVTRGGANQ